MKWDMIVYALIGALFLYGSHIFSGKYVSKTIDTVTFNLWRFIYMGIFAVLYLLFINRQLKVQFKKEISPKNHFYILLASIAMLIGNSLLITGINRFGSHIMPTFEVGGILLSLLIGTLFYGEKITIRTSVAIILMILGIYIYDD